MDVQDRLNELTAMVRSAKAMPMSGSCLVNRAEMLDVVERLRKALPATLHDAQALLTEREAVLAAAREQAETMVAEARGQREQLIGQADVLVAARARAAAAATSAREESTRLLADADVYVDRKLAEFEVVLGQLASQVNNGRLRLSARREAGSGRESDADDETARPGAGYDGAGPDTAAETGSPPGVGPQAPALGRVSLAGR